jgi:threonine dehydrogenase-like Zn-dependent dehydrogenase
MITAPALPCPLDLPARLPQDVVLRVTSTCICGSDLHL